MNDEEKNILELPKRERKKSMPHLNVDALPKITDKNKKPDNKKKDEDKKKEKEKEEDKNRLRQT